MIGNRAAPHLVKSVINARAPISFVHFCLIGISIPRFVVLVVCRGEAWQDLFSINEGSSGLLGGLLVTARRMKQFILPSGYEYLDTYGWIGVR
jgi:hypothetical protein